jgi:phosphatidylglycerol:prolipoprotein diacylglycerol transferase
MIGIGIVAAYFLAEYRAEKLHLDSNYIFSFLVFGLLGGFLGAKILYLLTIIKELVKDPSPLLNPSNGFVVYGGIIGGIAAVLLYCKVKKLPFLRYLDLLIPSLALAQGFGRIGCFLAGCCYGIRMNGPFSVVFQHSAFAPNGVALFPSQIVSSCFDFLNALVLCILARHNKKEGNIMAFYLIFYSAGRFCIEFFRGDLDRGAVGILSTSQFISILIMAAGIFMYVFVNRRKNVPQE